MKLYSSPFESNRQIGSVILVSPDSVRINLRSNSVTSTQTFAGYPVLGGLVGEFVFIECEDFAVMGRIVEVKLPENEKPLAEKKAGKPPELHPVAAIQLLTSLKLSTGEVVVGLPQYPRIGQRVFSAHPLLVKQVIEGIGETVEVESSIHLAEIPQESNTNVNISPEKLFGRHCAILGATGGGKSWTVARVIQEIARCNGKAILIDPTGEFYTFKDGVYEVSLGGQKNDDQDTRTFVSFPYWDLTELDLFAIFQPSGASQAPKLREALTSLKLNYLLNGENEPFNVVKMNTEKALFNRAWAQNQAAVEAEGAKYLIKHLPKQIQEECVSDSKYHKGEQDFTHWGGSDERVRSYCITLVAKIYQIIKSKSLRCIFEPHQYDSLTEHITKFLDSDKKILRISMQDLPFENNAREILTNCIGRFLLGLARDNKFKKLPLVVILDEAHQFLNKQIGDETNSVQLDAFGLIAKEGRKYGLTTVLATQRPRDIPEDVLSQMGTFIVHRLINERDRLVVEKACGHLDGSAAAFLPTLGQGEAIIVGVDIPMPSPVKIKAPKWPPNSFGPNYSDYWKPPAK